MDVRVCTHLGKHHFDLGWECGIAERSGIDINDDKLMLHPFTFIKKNHCFLILNINKY